MTTLNAFLNSYWDFVLFAFALLLLFAIIKGVLIIMKTFRKIYKKNLWKY